MTNTRLTPDILENNRLQSGQRAILQGNSSVRDFLVCGGVRQSGLYNMCLMYIFYHYKVRIESNAKTIHLGRGGG